MFFVKFFGAVAAIASGLVIGLFVFFAISQALSAPTHPQGEVSVSNGSTAHYYDPSKGTAADAFAEADARATKKP